MGEGFTWLTVDPDTASGHLGVCVYVFFEKNRGSRSDGKAGGSGQMGVEQSKAIAGGKLNKFQVKNSTFSAL